MGFLWMCIQQYHMQFDLLLCLSVIAFISCCSMLSSEALSAGVGSDLRNQNKFSQQTHQNASLSHVLSVFKAKITGLHEITVICFNLRDLSAGYVK